MGRCLRLDIKSIVPMANCCESNQTQVWASLLFYRNLQFMTSQPIVQQVPVCVKPKRAVELNAIAAAAVSPCFPSSFLHPSWLRRSYHFWRRFMKCPVLRSAAHLRFMKRPLREKETERERSNPIYQPSSLLWLCRYNLTQMHHSIKEGLFDVRRWTR